MALHQSASSVSPYGADGVKGDHSPLKQEAGGEAVHRDGEEALCLGGVDVHCDDLLGPRNLQHTSYQLQQQPVTSRAGRGQ